MGYNDQYMPPGRTVRYHLDPATGEFVPDEQVGSLADLMAMQQPSMTAQQAGTTLGSLGNTKTRYVTDPETGELVQNMDYVPLYSPNDPSVRRVGGMPQHGGQLAGRKDAINELMAKVAAMSSPGYSEEHPDAAYSSRTYRQGVPNIKERPEYKQLMDLLGAGKLQADIMKTTAEAANLSDNVGNQLKRAQLMELMGQDPSQMMPQVGQPGVPQGQAASSQELAGQVNAARQKFLARRFGTPPTGHRWDEAGNAVSIPGLEKPLTEFQGKSSGFGVRAASAHEQLNALEDGGLGGEFDMAPGYRNGPVQPGMIKRSAEALPLIGEGMGTALNFTQSAAQQRVDQAQRNFVNATLRQESGAAISAGEWDNAKKQYFPQPGDDASVIEQKRLNRAQVIGGFKTSAGRDGSAPIAPAQSSMRDSLQQEMAARAEAINVIKANPAVRDEVIKRMQAAKYSTKGL